MRAEPGPGRIDEDGAVLGDSRGQARAIEVIIEADVLAAEPGVVRLGHDVEPQGVPLVEGDRAERVVLEDTLSFLPEGMRIETVPGLAKSERSFAQFSLAAESGDGRSLRVRRELTILKNKIPADQFPVLKLFFGQARAGDESQVILALEKR